MTPFKFNKTSSAPDPDLGPLALLASHAFHGNDANFIFRPQSPLTPTPLPTPQPNSDNILEINLTQETLTFSAALGSIPNRGSAQGDIFLNGISYEQLINDMTDPANPVGIHNERGHFCIVPPTTAPPVPTTSIFRQGSIPHGAAIDMQGGWSTISGPPTIPPVDITPFNAGGKIRFASQTAATPGTPRIPQDLTPFIAAGTITQAMLDDPNTVLRSARLPAAVTTTSVVQLATHPVSPLFGGGTNDIAFLLGDPAGAQPNANAVSVTATFWVMQLEGGVVALQYSQLIILSFNGLSWPHVNCASLIREY